MFCLKTTHAHKRSNTLDRQAHSACSREPDKQTLHHTHTLAFGILKNKQTKKKNIEIDAWSLYNYASMAW